LLQQSRIAAVAQLHRAVEQRNGELRPDACVTHLDAAVDFLALSRTAGAGVSASVARQKSKHKGLTLSISAPP